MKFLQTIQSKRTTDGTDSARKRNFHLSASERPQCTDSYWSEGSRDQYKVFNLDTGRTTYPSAGKYPWTTENNYTLQPGDVLVETGICCGNPAEARMTCLPADLDRVMKWLGVAPHLEIK